MKANTPKAHLVNAIAGTKLPKALRTEQHQIVEDVVDLSIIKKIAKELLKEEA
jgi:hypothetical protein